MMQGGTGLAIAAFVIGVVVALGFIVQARRAKAATVRLQIPPREPVLPPAPDDVYLAYADTDGLITGDAFRDRINTIAARSKLPVLGSSDIDRLARIIDARKQQRDSFVRTAPIALVRQARQGVDITTAGTSWFGGVPAMGNTPWPRSAQGRPLHHLLQIDLTYLPADLVPQAMPRDGSLCFFVGTDHGAGYAHKVIHVPAGKVGPTSVPAGLPALFEGPDWGHHITGHTLADAPTTFARWPLSFFALPMTDPEDATSAGLAMEQTFDAQNGADLQVARYAGPAPHLTRPWLWDSAQRVVNSLVLAEEEIPKTIADARKRVTQYGQRYAPELDFMLANAEAFRRYVQAARRWVAGHDPFTPMGENDIALLEAMFVQIKTPRNRLPSLALFYRYSRGHMNALRDALNETLLTVAREKPAVFDLLPAVVRADIDARHRLPTRGRWHQMFGLGTQVQTAVTDHASDHLLLQLHTDRLLQWSWGDMGVLQFWISADDMAAGRWDAVALTVESH